MKRIDQLSPHPVWKFFSDILAIPRPSGREEKMAGYIRDFARSHGLEANQDSACNLLVKKKAYTGYENKKTIVLQSHLDMVCEKDSQHVHNFDTDPIQAFVDGDWVKAKGTTLGADNGIGVATQLAILADPELIHGPLECLFTLDEETGLNGAKGLQTGFFDGRVLINLDSEDEGELFIGCAGGMNTVATLQYAVRKTPEASTAFRIEVAGLQGGHSGTDIHKNRGNSVKILNQLLWEIRNRFGARLSLFEGGNLRNAIPRESFAIVVVPNQYKEVLPDYFHDYTRLLLAELIIDEPSLRIGLLEAPLPEKVLKKKVQEKLLNSIYACPNGVISWSRVMPGLVETSTNLASVKFEGMNRIVIATSQRSSVNTAKQQIANAVRSTFKLAGAKVTQTEGYPGWNPNPDSEILNITRQAYARLFHIEPEVKAIHAGLECGLFLEKYPYLDMISFGPTILDPHSPSERVSISTTEKFWILLLEVLRSIPEEN